jgi:acyl dehydratase
MSEASQESATGGLPPPPTTDVEPSVLRRRPEGLEPDGSKSGKRYRPYQYEVSREKVREYARVIGERNPLYFDRDAARGAGFRDIVAPPTFVVVYSVSAIRKAIFDPELRIDMARLLHGAQEFEWFEPVCVGDVISTTLQVGDIFQKGTLWFVVFETTSTNQQQENVVNAKWTWIIRGA